MLKSPLFLIMAAVFLLLVGALTTQFVLRASPGTTASAASASPAALAQGFPIQPGSGFTSGILVTGEGRVTVKPDLAKITLGVEVTNQSASAAQQAAASQMDAVVSKLKEQGVTDKDIQTVRYDLSPEYDNSNNRSPVLKGYRATNLVMVTLRDLTKVGPVLDTVAASGATRIQGISFSVSDPTSASTQGRDEAMKNAKTKADQMAKAAGVTVGTPLYIEETSTAAPPPVPMSAGIAAPSAAPVQTPISAGTQEVTTTVRVVYSIK